jgi:Zn-dependent protease with chaperone function
MTTANVQAQYFDGHTARAHTVTLSIHADLLQVRGESVQCDVDATQVDWGEYTRHSARMVHLPGGAMLQIIDSQALESLLAAQGIRTSKVAALTTRWSLVLGALGLLIALLLGGYFWGIPAGARVAAPLIPHTYQRMIGESTLRYIDREWLKPSALPKEQQEALLTRWNMIVASAYPNNSAPVHTIVFRQFPQGPNAFALPGGTIVLTDELVSMMAGDDDAIMGVLAHELGHLKYHHSMRLLIEVSALTLGSSMIIGDYSGFLANAPVIFGQLSYTRRHEREADEESLAVMNAARLDRMSMVRFFEKIRTWRPAQTAPQDNREQSEEQKAENAPANADTQKRRTQIPELLSSHPLDEERIAFFRNGRPD